MLAKVLCKKRGSLNNWWLSYLACESSIFHFSSLLPISNHPRIPNNSCPIERFNNQQVDSSPVFLIDKLLLAMDIAPDMLFRVPRFQKASVFSSRLLTWVKDVALPQKTWRFVGERVSAYGRKASMCYPLSSGSNGIYWWNPFPMPKDLETNKAALALVVRGITYK